MSGLTGNNILGGASGQSDAYDISNSLMFDDNDTSRLERTPSSAGNRKTWTWSGWVKRANLGTNQNIFNAYELNVRGLYFQFTSADVINIGDYIDNTGWQWQLTTTAVYRDVSSWYHIVLKVDTTQATSSDRVKLYINGEQVTSFSTSTYPSLNWDGEVNRTIEHNIGRIFANTWHLDAYLAEVNFIDGQALTPSDFGKTNIKTNQWVAQKYKGSYGTNGFYLNFNDSSSIGNDSSGNSNNFTAQNLVAADIKTDTPTNNFATLNSTTPDLGTNGGAPTYTPAYRNGNLMTTNPPSTGASTIVIPRTGKWYAEFRVTGVSGGPEAGMKNIENFFSPSVTSNFASYRIYAYTPNSAHVAGKDINNVDTALASLTFNGGGPYEWAFAYDADNGVFKYYYNGTLVATESSVDTSYDYVFFIKNTWNTGGGTYYANFGQDSTMHGTITGGSYTDANGYGEFKYQPPADHLALCTANLPDPSIALSNKHFDTTLVSGDGSNRSITGLNFQPDFLWGKSRTNTLNHYLTDSIRGVNSQLYSDASGTQGSESVIYTAFNSNGFSLGTGDMNTSGQNYVHWGWKAGGTASSNGDGTITSSVSANPTAGFSIVSYTGNATAGATVGHGLSQAPELVITKERTNADSWLVFSEPLGNTKALFLSESSAPGTHTTYWNNTSPSSTVVTLGSDNKANGSGTIIMYCFHSVEFFSKVSFYRGNSNANGPFVFTGFRPAFVMIKALDRVDDWIIVDNKRDPSNIVTRKLNPNTNAAEITNHAFVDFVSSGFKIRDTSDKVNYVNYRYLYLAFAESPFKYSNGR